MVSRDSRDLSPRIRDSLVLQPDDRVVLHFPWNDLTEAVSPYPDRVLKGLSSPETARAGERGVGGGGGGEGADRWTDRHRQTQRQIHRQTVQTEKGGGGAERERDGQTDRQRQRERAGEGGRG